MDVTAPVEMYDAMHRGLLQTDVTGLGGMLAHLARPTRTGFQVIEVWESREPYLRYTDELVVPAMTRLLGDGPPPTMETEEFEVRGLVLPRGGIAR
jgi:hypothetical protein